MHHQKLTGTVFFMRPAAPMAGVADRPILGASGELAAAMR